ncbi:MAG: thymidine kinase [Bdellovibrionota bacterium]
MAKLYFRYGTVSSAKSLNLLAVVHNYQMQNKKVLLIKPKIDDRYGKNIVRSRAGLEKKADLLVDEESHKTVPMSLFEGASCVVVDEAQFLDATFIDLLRSISLELNIPVICYGLRTDFRRNLFAGSRRLLELADAIEEVKTVCNYCNSKAVYNLKLLNGNPTTEGPQIELGAEESYLPVCGNHYEMQFADYSDVDADTTDFSMVH